jgi:hypothetical protein
MIAIDFLSENTFGQTIGAVERIADGLLGSNSTLLKINLSSCAVRDPFWRKPRLPEHDATETHTGQ